MPHLAESVLSILITLHMPFVNGLVQSASVWLVAIISHSVNGISSESSLIVTRDIHATIDAGISLSRKVATKYHQIGQLSLTFPQTSRFCNYNNMGNHYICIKKC